MNPESNHSTFRLNNQSNKFCLHFTFQPKHIVSPFIPIIFLLDQLDLDFDKGNLHQLVLV